MQTLQERLKIFITSLDSSVLAFENKCGMAPGTVNKMSNKSRPKTLEKIHKQFPQLNMGWLQTGEGQMMNPQPSVDIDVDLKLGGHSQFAMRDIQNIGDAKTQIVILQERIKSLEKELGEKNKRIEELNASLERERKMNDYLMGQK